MERSERTAASASAVECANNQATRTCWNEYAEHRRAVTDLICEAGISRDSPSLCLIGAGNVNDVSLAEVLAVFRSVAFVDLDRRAVLDGIARQAVAQPSGPWQPDRIEVLAPVDITSISSLLAPHIHRRIDRRALDQLAQSAMRTLAGTMYLDRHPAAAGPHANYLPHGGPYDAVVSCALLSQLIRQVNETFGTSEHARAVGELVVTTHLELTLAMTKPGGSTIIVTDFAKCGAGEPIDNLALNSSLQSIVENLTAKKRLFTSLSPPFLSQVLASPQFQPYIAAVRPSALWRWTISTTNQYICYGLQITRSDTELGHSQQLGKIQLATRLRDFVTRTGIPTSHH